MKYKIFFIAGLLAAGQAQAQVSANDAALHTLKPAYAVPYEPMPKEQIKAVLDKVFNYLNAVTPAQMINKQTGEVVDDVNKMDSNTVMKQGDFRITSYEWGVLYSGMLWASEETGDKKFATYVKERFDFLAKWIPAVQKAKTKGVYNGNNYPLHQPVDPKALDDAGAMCAAMIKSQRQGLNINLRPQIDHYMNWVFNKQFRLSDGTLARIRPQNNTLWLDDLYMGVPALAQMGKLTGDKKYFDDAVKQIKQFSERMFIKEKGVYMHGWVESMETHPAFKWARANGWALMAMTELLDVLPENYPGRKDVIEQFKAHAKGLAALQSGSGFWHQLLDREDSYLETSATAIYSYCIAHACNKGWIDPITYAPMAMLAWNAVTTKINDKGQVEGTCVGTGMAFDPAFYYYRPVNVLAAHGYGPLFLAGAEMYKMMEQNKYTINDSALMYQ
ncbi:MAG: glycoside hydrolase family 88 protein [Bacteroidetes bacterium]|nr:glycoside hydrolase family 88 protein [Bacteroidota bacterium]